MNRLGREPNPWDLCLGDLVTHRVKGGLGFGIIIKDTGVFRVLWPDGRVRRHKPLNIVYINSILEE